MFLLQLLKGFLGSCSENLKRLLLLSSYIHTCLWISWCSYLVHTTTVHVVLLLFIYSFWKVLLFFINSYASRREIIFLNKKDNNQLCLDIFCPAAIIALSVFLFLFSVVFVCLFLFFFVTAFLCVCRRWVSNFNNTICGSYNPVQRQNTPQTHLLWRLQRGVGDPATSEGRDGITNLIPGSLLVTSVFSTWIQTKEVCT